MALSPRVPSGKAESDRPTPVLNHQSDFTQVERQDEPLKHSGMLSRLEVVARTRRAKAKSRVVRCHTPEPTRQLFDDVAVEEGLRGIAVKEQQRGSGSLINVMNPVALDLHKAAVKRIKLFIKLLRAHRRILHCLPLLSATEYHIIDPVSLGHF